MTVESRSDSSTTERSATASMPTPAEVLTARMKAQRLTLRGVVNAGKKFSDRDPETFHELKKALVWSVLQPGYITPSKPSAAIMNTLIMTIYDGDWRAFDEDTRYTVQHTLRSHNEDLPRPGALVEHYLEGEAPMKQRNRRARPQVPGTDFLFTTRSDALAPNLASGVTAECRRLNNQELQAGSYLGHAVILQDKHGLLSSAWYVGQGTFQRESVELELSANDNVFGVITFITPTLAGLPMPASNVVVRPVAAPARVTLARSTPALPAKTITLPAPRRLQVDVAEAAMNSNVSIRAYLEEAVLDLVVAAENDLSVIPSDEHLERVREDGENPIMSHLISGNIHQRLKALTVELTRHGQRRYYMNELVLHALHRKLQNP